MTTPTVNLSDIVSVNVSYSARTGKAVYTFYNVTTKHMGNRVRTIKDPATNGAECVVEQGAYSQYGGYDAVPFRGCTVHWTNSVTLPGAVHGSTSIGSTGDPGPVTDVYGYVGYAHNSLDTHGDFTVTCLKREQPASSNGPRCIG